MPELKRFKLNSVEHKKIYGLKDEEDEENDPLEQALIQNELEECPEHTKQLLDELRQAIKNAYSSLVTDDPPDGGGDD